MAPVISRITFIDSNLLNGAGFQQNWMKWFIPITWPFETFAQSHQRTGWFACNWVTWLCKLLPSGGHFICEQIGELSKKRNFIDTDNIWWSVCVCLLAVWKSESHSLAFGQGRYCQVYEPISGDSQFSINTHLNRIARDVDLIMEVNLWAGH